MRAAVIHGHGGPEVLSYVEAFADPRPAAGEVILEVGASSLNYHDIFTRRGMPGITVPMPMIMGIDLAGTVRELGPGVTGVEVGDREIRITGRNTALERAVIASETPGAMVSKAERRWCTRLDSNQWPLPSEGSALSS